MAELVDQIRVLRDRYAAKLAELHNDYTLTRMLWNDMLVRAKRYGDNAKPHDPVIDPEIETVVNDAELGAKARSSTVLLRVRVFKDVVAQFELFVQELLEVWLVHKPQWLEERAISITILLSSDDLAEVRAAAIREATQKAILDKLFGPPDRWFKFLRRVIDQSIGMIGEEQFVEMKARRDILEHRNGEVEITYLKKAGRAAKYALGAFVQLKDADVDDAFGIIGSLLDSTANAAIRAA